MAGMNAPAISRYPVPALDDLPDDIRARILEVQEKAGFVPNVFVTLAHRPDEFRAFFAYHDALMEKEGGLTEGRARDDRGRDVGRERLPVLHRRARRDPAHLRARIRSSPTRSRPTTARPTSRRGRRRCSRSRSRSRLASSEIGDDDFDALRAHGFSDEDAWDIGAIAAFFALSNRMANLIGMRPNDEFYLMGRVPRASRRAQPPQLAYARY